MDRLGMIDVTEKAPTVRTAVSEAFVAASEDTLDRIERGETPKGEVLTAARAAALMASKTTHLVLPHCHPLAVTHADVGFERTDRGLRIEVGITAIDRTGVEMESLHAALVAALTVYDMLKFNDPSMRIEGVRLLKKRGGKSDYDATRR